MELWALLLVGTAALTAYAFIADYRKRAANKVPGPKPLPIVGNTIENLRNFERIFDWHVECTRKYGPTWSFTVINEPRRVMTVSVANVEHILSKRFDNYEKGDGFKDRFRDVVGDTVFNTDGPLWKEQRALAAKVFSTVNLRDTMSVVFVDHGIELLEVLDEVPPGGAINMHDIFHRYTLDCISEIAFGLKLGCTKNGNVPFAKAFDAAQASLIKRFVRPFWRLAKLVSADEAKLREHTRTLEAYTQAVIKERRENPGESRNKTDMLAVFMNAEGKDFSDHYLAKWVMFIFVAGRDTTAAALSWAFYSLAKHPEVEERLYQEIVDKFGDSTPNYDVKGLKYLNAVVDEVLRLYPSIGRVPKTAVNDDVLPDGTEIKAGDWVVYMPYAMGRMTDIWGEDAEEFKPERWLEKPTKPPVFQCPTFQAAPRTCLGQTMAVLEMGVLIAMIVQKYRLRLVPGQNITYQNSFTLSMKGNSMMMTVEKR